MENHLSRGAFGHERLTVYRLAVELYGIVLGFAPEVGARNGALAEQLRYAAAAIVLQVAEGAGELSPRAKSRAYRLALRSVSECAAALDLSAMVVRGTVEWPEGARSTLHGILGLLTRMANDWGGNGPAPRRGDDVEPAGERVSRSA